MSARKTGISGFRNEGVRIKLHVPGFDTILPKGIRRGSLILIVGPPGAGKTVLAMQLLMEMRWSYLRPGEKPKPAIFFSADESKSVLERQRDCLLRRDKHDEPMRKLDVLPLKSVQQADQDKEQWQSDRASYCRALEDRLEDFYTEYRDGSYCAIGLDGTANLPELRGASAEMRREALTQTAKCLRWLVRRNPEDPGSMAAIMTAELPTHAEDVGVSQLEEYLADVVIRIGVKTTRPGKVRRYLEITKARYVESVLGQHSLWIMSASEVAWQEKVAATLGWSTEAMADIRKGVVVFPRMRWCREAGTGPLSKNLEDALLSLRQHVSKYGPSDAKAVLRNPDVARALAMVLRSGRVEDLYEDMLGEDVEKLFLGAVSRGWRWPQLSELVEIDARKMPPLRLDWTDRLPEGGNLRSVVEGFGDVLRADSKKPARSEGKDGKLQVTAEAIEDLCEQFKVMLDGVVERHRARYGQSRPWPKPEIWEEGSIRAAAMGMLEILAVVERGRAPKPYCSFGVRGLDEMFGASGQGEEEELGVTRGSSTAMVGGPGTGKSMLAYCFMLQGLIHEEDVIFLSFDERHKRILRDAGNLTVGQADDTSPKTLARMAALQILESDIRIPPDHSRFRFVYEDPINVDIHRLMYFLQREIESLMPSREMLAGQERRRCRLIVDSLSDLERNIGDPRVFNDFVTTLLNKTIDWDVTTLLVYEASETTRGDVDVGRLLSFMADNVIVLRQVQVNNTMRKCVSIRKARGRRHDSCVAELVFARGKGSTFRVVVRKGFEGMSNVLSGQPKPAQIDLRLFSENRCEKAWNDRFVGEMKSFYGEEIRHLAFRLEHIRAAFWHRLKQRDISPNADVTIVSLDQPWVWILSQRTELASPLLACWVAKEAGPSQRMIVDDLLPELRAIAAAPPAEAAEERPLLALPIYHDIGLLLRRMDILPEGGHEPEHWEKLPPGETKAESLNPSSFESVLGGLVRKDPDVVGFAFDMDNVNSVACLFTELCWNFGATDNFLVNELQRETNVQCAVEALLFLARLRKTGVLPYPCTLAHCKEAVYTRLWYANIATLYGEGETPLPLRPVPFLTSARHRLGKKTIPLSSDSATAPDGSAVADRTRPRWCCGAWCLGVLSSGGNANLGWSIVMEALDRRRIRDRALDGAGLPVSKAFYRLYGDEDVPFLDATTFNDLKADFFPKAQSRMLAFGLGTPSESEGQPTVPDIETLSAMPERLHSLVMNVLADSRWAPEDLDDTELLALCTEARAGIERLVRDMYEWVSDSSGGAGTFLPDHVREVGTQKAEADKPPADAQSQPDGGRDSVKS